MPIVVTIGSASANSYVTTVEFYSYWSKRLIPSGQETPDSFGVDDVEMALLDACVWLDGESYGGSVISPAQALKFPRASLYDSDGRSISSTTIPQALKDAQCELAYALLLDPDLADGDAFAGYSSIGLGSGEVNVALRVGAVSSLPSRVIRLLQNLRTGRQARILRA